MASPRRTPGRTPGRTFGSLPLWVFALVGTLPTFGFWLSGLLDLDEGYYGAVVAEMNRRGEWITPYYNGHPWFEKPILLYWLAKPCLVLFGESGARLPSALCLFALLLAAALFARRAFGESAARLAPLVLGGMVLPAVLGRLMMTDMPLALFLSLALFAFARAVPLLSEAEGDSRPLLAFAGAALGAATLAKGPVALILFLPPVLWTLRGLGWPRFRGWTGLAGAYAAVVALWYVPAYLASGPVFVQRFLIEQNVGRFTGGDAAHTLGLASLPLYVPVVLLGALPYTAGVFRVWRGGSPVHSLLRAWTLWTFVFFTISGAKLPHYVLPLFPPLALLVADRLSAKAAPALLPRAAAWCAVLGVLLAGVQTWWYAASGNAEAHRLLRAARRDPNLVLYRLSRRQKGLGTGGTKIQETSLPSLLLVADRDLPDVETLDGRLGAPTLTIFTRTDRLGPAEYAAIRAAGLREVGRTAGAHYLVERFAR